QVVVAVASTLYAVGLDGQPRWTVRTRLPVDVAALETNPATGTTCLTGDEPNNRPGRKARSTWYLACYDRDGNAVATRRFRPRGLGLAAQPRWTVRTRLPVHVAALETTPATGTTCLTGDEPNNRPGRKARSTWYLACYDRDGNPVATRRFGHRGLTDGPTALA